MLSTLLLLCMFDIGYTPTRSVKAIDTRATVGVHQSSKKETVSLISLLDPLLRRTWRMRSPPTVGRPGVRGTVLQGVHGLDAVSRRRPSYMPVRGDPVFPVGEGGESFEFCFILAAGTVTVIGDTAGESGCQVLRTRENDRLLLVLELYISLQV